MTKDSTPDRPMIARLRTQRGIRPRALFLVTPLVLAFALAGCETIDDATDYVGDLFSYVDEDAEVFADGTAPGADEPYRSLHEVPAAAPLVASARDRAMLAVELTADRARTQNRAETLRLRMADAQAGGESGSGQIRAIYRPAEAAVLAPSNDG